MKTALLLSGGPDSSALAYDLATKGEDVLAIHLNLGEPESAAGLKSAAKVSADLGIETYHIDLSDALEQIYKSPAPMVLRGEVDRRMSVPFGSGVALSIAASVTSKMNISSLNYAVHRGDKIFRDNNREYFDSLSKAISIDLGKDFTINTPFLDLSKAEVFRRGAAAGLDLSGTWSCGMRSDIHCGECMTCGSRKQAFSEASLIDDTSYLVASSAEAVV